MSAAVSVAPACSTETMCYTLVVPERIVVVDDHPDSRDVAVMSLEHAGFEVEAFSNAEEALQRVIASPPHVVVTDVTLPGWDGSELARRIHANPQTKHVALIAVTGRASIAAEHFDRVLQKPFDPASLCGAVRLVLVELARRATVHASEGAPAVAATPEPRLAAMPPMAAPPPMAGTDSPVTTADVAGRLLDAAPVMLWRVGSDATRVWFNAGWLAFTGRTMEQECGAGWLQAVHDEDREHVKTHFSAVFSRGEPFEAEYRLRVSDGSWRWVLDRGAPYADAAGASAGYVGACIDIDERKKRDLARVRFLDFMAHELRTPLTPLKAHLHVLGNRAVRGEVVGADVVAKLSRQTDRLVELIDKIGDAARLELAKGLRVAREETDLVTLVHEVVKKFIQDHAAGATQHSVEIHAPPGDPRPVSVDPDVVRRAVRILLDNAVKFSPERGEVNVRIVLDEEVAVEVEDHGIGIPPQEVALLGRPYFHASNAPSPRYMGMGLGLSVVWEVARAHGGTVDVDSRLGAGTRIRLVLAPRKQH